MSIRIEHEESRVSTLTICRPEKHNALDSDHVDQLLEHLRAVASRRETHVLVITGEGEEAFSAGADLREMTERPESEVRDFLVRTRKLFRALSDLEIPTLAAVNGHAHGAGAEIACICDLRLGCPLTTFRFPGLSYGMAVGTWHLPSVVGLPKAKELLFTTSVIGAEEALEIGLVNRVVPQRNLLEQSRELGRRIAAHDGRTTRAVKSLLNRTVGAPLQQRFFRELYTNQEQRRFSFSRSLFRKALEDERDHGDQPLLGDVDDDRH